MTRPNLILVVGDAMLDRHIHGTTERMSPEAPVPVVLKEREEWAIGAAANVSAHMTACGIPCTMMFKGCQRGDGSDDNSEKLYRMCYDRGILPRPLVSKDPSPVTVKTRIWSNGQQVCRIDEEDTSKPEGATEAAWINEIRRMIDEHSPAAVVFSDYDKGTLTDGMIFNIAAHCANKGIPTVLDPKRRTFSDIRGVTVAKPNVRELKATGLSAVECSAKMGSTWLINTLGKDGMAVFKDGELVFSCPTVAQEVVDVCGCGDTVTAFLAMALAVGKDIREAVAAANRGASFTIKHKGCYVPNIMEIKECLGE